MCPLFRPVSYVTHILIPVTNASRPPPNPRFSLAYDTMQMYTAMFAGFDTTSVTISRMLQMLDSDDVKKLDLIPQLLSELDKSITAGE